MSLLIGCRITRNVDIYDDNDDDEDDDDDVDDDNDDVSPPQHIIAPTTLFDNPSTSAK